MPMSQAAARSARRKRQDTRRRHDRDEVNLRRRDDDKVLFTRSALPPALGYAPYLLALSPVTLPDLDHLSAGRYQVDKGRYHWSLTSVIGIPPSWRKNKNPTSGPTDSK